MKRTLMTFLVVFPIAAHSQFGGGIVHDPRAQATRLLEYAEQIIEVKQSLEKLINISGVTDLLEYLSLEEFAALREHAPRSFLEVLAVVSEIEGGVRAIDDLLRALSNYDVDSKYSRDKALQELYEFRLQNLKKTKAYAAVDYEKAGESIEAIDASTGVASTFETQKQRDAAQVKTSAEVAKSNYRILQSLAQLTDLMATQRVEDFDMQRRHMETVSDRSSLIYTGK